jgi:putative ABC transport system permease protein
MPRDRGRTPMLIDSLLQDLRVGARGLIKDRGFTLLAVAVLALGICGVTTQLSVIRGLIWRGLPFPDSEALMDVQIRNVKIPNAGFGFGIQTADFLEIVQQQTSFTELAAYLNGSTVNATIGGNALRLTGGYVTDNFFNLLGVRPILGRTFVPSDNRPEAERVTIIGHGLWQREFGGAPDVIGKTFRMNGRTATVVGVMPAGFQFPVNEQLWVPLYNEFPPRSRDDPQALAPAVFGRIKPGVTLDSAKVELDGLAKRLALEYPKSNQDLTDGQVQPLIRNFMGPQIRNILKLMLGAVVAVLVIACVNVMNMQFARATLRAKELAIRGALGASRLRLIRQMLTESAILASVGATLGVAGAVGAIELLTNATRSLPFPLPFWVHFSIDLPVLCVVVLVVMATVFLSGFVPAVLAARANAAEVLKESGRGNTSRLVSRLTGGLVVAQIALTFALLIACTLMVRSIVNQQNVGFGYDTGSVMTARMGLFQADYPTAAARHAFFQKVLRELRGNPDVSSAAVTSRFRMTFTGPTQFELDGKAQASPTDAPRAMTEGISDGYFDTLGLRPLEGREFTLNDADARLPVALVNASFARKHFGNESPVGKRIRRVNPEGPWRTIVGVVPDTQMQGPFPAQGLDASGYFVPIEFEAPPFATIVLRGRGPAEGLAEVLRREMSKLDPNLPLYFVGTPKTLLNETLAQNRILATLFSIFGLVGVVLSAVGLYGVMSFSVNQRTVEFGIRMALGADAGVILKTVLRQGMFQLCVGVAIGLVGAFGLLAVLKSALANFLFGVDPQDPVMYGAVLALLAVVAMAASLAPARRATRVDPMIALRGD